jgi:alpha-tubulin suppressor-like RCC1 family protein
MKTKFVDLHFSPVVIALCLLTVQMEAQTVIKVAAGNQCTLFLKSNGGLWSMGFNFAGELGDGTYNFNGVARPEKIVFSNVLAITTGNEGHSMFIKNDGSLWVTGYNNYGQLGDGTFNNTNRPEMIVASNVVAVAAGAYHSLILKKDGSLWAAGARNYGQLGDGSLSFGSNRFEMIVASNVTAIAAGDYHSLFIKSDGSLWGMGYNRYGELGIGFPSTNYPYGTNLPVQIVASNVVAVASGSLDSLFLKADGSLWGMGWNNAGELGDGTYNEADLPKQIMASNVTAIAVGDGSSLFIKNDGSLWAMGYNNVGQLGDGTTNYYVNLPEQIVPGHVTAIAAGDSHNLFFKDDGSLWAMGHNYSGELGDGTRNNTNRPEMIVPPNYNQLTAQPLNGSRMRLSFVGDSGANYALERSFNLSSSNWTTQTTNTADFFGILSFTNSFTNLPTTITNIFWRVRSVSVSSQ